MMNRIYVLNAGRADCIVIMLKTDGRRKIIVIDGGTKEFEGRSILAEFLLEHGIDTIDLLVLTHLHQDHFGGFYNLIDQIKVLEAAVPYGDIIFHEAFYKYYAEEQYFREYHEVFKYFVKTNTAMIDTYQNDQTEFQFGLHRLKCLYPITNVGMKIPACIDKLCSDHLSISDMKEYGEIFKAYCNQESSIWALENNSECIAIFAGDSTSENMKSAVISYGRRPRMLKLSHHGIGTQYFDREQLELVSPQDVVVSTSKEFFPKIKEGCEQACHPVNAKIHYTFNANYQLLF